MLTLIFSGVVILTNAFSNILSTAYLIPNEKATPKSGLIFLVGRQGFEPRTKGFRLVWVSPLSGLCLHHMPTTRT